MDSNIKVKEILTKSYINPSKLPGMDYVINPYIGCPHRCMYCYAEFMKRFSNHEEEWGTFTDVKIRSTSSRPVDLRGKNVFLSSVTDCYNPLEEKYLLTRKLLQQLHYSGANITILTKSTLVLRDMDLLKQIPDITVGFSINTTDETFRQDTEPGAAPIQARLNALQTLHNNGIRTWIHVSPIFPYLSNWKEVLDAAKEFTDKFTFENLKLRAASLSRVLFYINSHHPHLLKLYEDLYKRNATPYWQVLSKDILAYCNQHNLAASVHFSTQDSLTEI